MGALFGGGDDSGISDQIALEQKEYDDNKMQIEQARADQDNQLLTIEHSQSGPLFSSPDKAGETVNPEPGT